MLDFLVLITGSLLAVLAMPNGWVPDGWGILGLVALVPVFWFTIRRTPGVSAFGGALWIVLVILLSQSWLIAFHPFAFPLVLLFQVPWYASAFFVSSWLWRRWPAGGVWAQALWWMAFEFLRIQGFFSYPYGSLSSSFWSFPLTWQSADLVGTSGITFLLAWGSAWLALLVCRGASWKRLGLDLTAAAALWTADLSYGAWKMGQAQEGPLWKPALVQQSQDPWAGGSSAYSAALDRLESLSLQALDAQPDVVVWSETAFVPSVDYHTRYHENPESLRLVRRLEKFRASSGVPFLLGNDHREKSSDGTLKDFNAVLAWDEGWRGRYEKNRLVPFTESFPYKDLLPWVHRWLVEADTHFWVPGRDRSLLPAGPWQVGTPICYEDAFPDATRAFSLSGARALVNVTNDSWAPGVASRMQHLSLAVFRSVETRLPLVRAGNDGATAVISAQGVMLARLPIGPPGVLVAEVPLGSGDLTWYTLTGDWAPWMALGVLLLGGLWRRERSESVVDKAEQL